MKSEIEFFDNYAAWEAAVAKRFDCAKVVIDDGEYERVSIWYAYTGARSGSGTKSLTRCATWCWSMGMGSVVGPANGAIFYGQCAPSGKRRARRRARVAA